VQILSFLCDKVTEKTQRIYYNYHKRMFEQILMKEEGVTMAKQRFFICRHCGNIIAYVKESGVKVVCCGEPMQELIPGTTDASLEKHVPVITVEGNIVTVTVGSAIHPMTDEHYIEWISLETEQGNQRKELKPGETPTAVFALADGDRPVAAYEHCNLHGLWKKSVE